MQVSSTTTPKTKVFASIAAYALILASAGFGAKYAWMIGIQNGLLMAYLSVIFAIALECIKPLAVAFAFTCFQQLQFIRGLLLSLLALVAVAYSLTAELSLIYSARSDLAAQRHSESYSATGSQQQYEAAQKELAALPKSRAVVAEVQAEITALQAKYRNVDWDCDDLKGAAKIACPQLSKLNAEIGVIQKREKLQATIDSFLSKAPEKNTQKLADPGSAAMTTYLSALGIEARQDVVAQWIVLIPIFALEIGSALGLLLVNAISDTAKIAVSHTETPDIQPGRAARRAIMRQLQEKPEANISQRRLAKQEGLDKSTIQRAMKELEQEGVIDLETHRKGTLLKLKKAQ